jgi:hypothetical protein
VGPSIRSNHNENTLLLREGELGHPKVTDDLGVSYMVHIAQIQYNVLVLGLELNCMVVRKVDLMNSFVILNILLLHGPIKIHKVDLPH